MPAMYWEVLVRTGFEFLWGGISVAVLAAFLAMLTLVSDWLARGLSEQTQPTITSACSNGHECYRLG